MILNPFSISCLLLIITCLSIIVIVLIYGKRILLHRLWILFNTAVFIWGLGGFLITQTTSESVAIALWKFALIGVIFTSVFFFHIVYVLCELHCKKILIIMYIQCILAVIADLAGLFTKLEFMFNSFYYPVAVGSAYPLLYLAWLLILGYGYYRLFKYYRHSHGIRRNQLLYFFIATAIGFFGGAVNFLPAFGSRIYPYSNFLIPAYCIIATYAILRYRLLDINIALTRTGIFIVVYALVLGSPFGIIIWARSFIEGLGYYGILIPLLVGMSLASAGPFIFLYLQRLAEKKLRKEEFHRQERLRQLSQKMMRVVDLNTLLGLIVRQLVRILKLESASIYFRQEEKYTLKPDWSWPLDPTLPKEIDSENILVKDTALRKLPIAAEELKLSSQKSSEYLKELLAELKKLKASYCIPCFLRKELSALLLLDSTENKIPLTQSDLNLLLLLSNQASLAIENALFHEQQDQIEHEKRKSEELASLGELVHLVGHEINNPITSVIGNVAVIKEVIEEDLIPHLPQDSPILKQLQQLEKNLFYAYRDAFRVVELKDAIVTIGSGKEIDRSTFKPLNIKDVVDNALQGELIRQQIKELNVEVKVNLDSSLPKILGSSILLEQGCFNLIRNALRAMQKSLLKVLTIEAKLKTEGINKHKTLLWLSISDTGEGMPREMLDKLFRPLYKEPGLAIRSKGMGMGLWATYKIIANHDGKIKVESELGKGTTFTIELPVVESNQK